MMEAAELAVLMVMFRVSLQGVFAGFTRQIQRAATRPSAPDSADTRSPAVGWLLGTGHLGVSTFCNKSYNPVCNMDWVVITYRLPAEPSRHRVAVWRELRKTGAVSLQQAAWAVPARPHLVEGIDRAAELVARADGEATVFEARPRDEAQAARLEELHTDAREAEWTEFLSECEKFEREIAKEISQGKLILAELDEEEQSMERMRRWFREIRSRDVFHAPSAEIAEHRLKECGEVLEDFADRVYEAGGTR